MAVAQGELGLPGRLGDAFRTMFRSEIFLLLLVLIAGLSGALLLVHIAGLLGGAMFCCFFDFLAFVFPAFASCAFCFSVECFGVPGGAV